MLINPFISDLFAVIIRVHSYPMFTDPIINQLIEQYPAPTWIDRSELLFEDVISTIISQQLSGKAADSIFKRFIELFTISLSPEERGSDKGENAKKTIFPIPEQVLDTNQEILREIGISRAKSQYIHNVAQAFINKDIEIEKIKRMTDEEVITVLTKIKGLGKWSAEMILIFTLNRPNIFSMGDLGLKNAIRNLYGITEKEKIGELVETWKPNKSLASWYLWRSLENR